MTNRKKTDSALLAAIIVGRGLQSGTLFAINLFFMSQGGLDLFIAASLALAWAGPSSILIMFGGYILATQIKLASNSDGKAHLQAYLIYRPTLLLILASTVIFISDVGSDTFKHILFSYLTFLTLTHITDIFLFYKKIRSFVILNIIHSLSIVSTSFIIWSDSSSPIVVLLIWISVYFSLQGAFAYQLVIDTTGLVYFFRNIREFMQRKIRSNFIVVLSSLSIGVLSIWDRVIFPEFMNEQNLALYLAAVTLAVPINLLASVVGKNALLKNFDSISAKQESQRVWIARVIGCFSVGIIFLPFQGMYVTNFTSYEFNLLLQSSLNLAACLMVISKFPLAQLYAADKQKTVTLIHLFVILLMTLPLIISSSDPQVGGLVRVVFFTFCLGSLFITARFLNYEIGKK